MSRPMLYVDTSAFLKVVVAERESKALRAAIADAALWSSALLDLEAHRAARRLGVPRQAIVTALEAIALVAPNDGTFAAARDVGPDELRSFDALHLAAALELGDELDAVVTYDDRLAAGCGDVGLAVLRPR